jgi:siderophore synthetase component
MLGPHGRSSVAELPTFDMTSRHTASWAPSWSRWSRWITAIEAGPLAELFERAGPLGAAASRDRLWRGAVREIAGRLLLGCARERLLDATRTHDGLRVALGDGPIALPRIGLGPFELDRLALDEVDDPRLDDPLAIIELLGEREQLALVDRARLRAEILDSIVNLAQARLARALRHALARDGRLTDPRLQDPEHFVTDGHPWHPMTRTRLGLRRAEVLRYAGEQLATTPVRCVDVEAGLARVAGSYLDEAHRWFGAPESGFVRLPIHPAQQRRIQALFPALWARGAIREVDRPAIPCRSLLSLRTVALAPSRHLKLACDVHTTSTRRHVSPMSVHNGPEVTRLLLDIQARDPITAPLHLMAEEAAAGLEPEALGPAGVHAGQLGAIVRTAAPDEQQVWVCAAMHERWPGTEELTLERAASGYPGGRAERVAALVDDWIAQLVPAALRLVCRYGVALELHLQNTLLRVTDGRADGFWVRDLGGIRLHGPRLAAAGLARAPSFAAGSFIVTDDLDEVRGKLEHTLFHAHLSQVFMIAGTLGVDEASSWAKLRRCVVGSLQAWAEEPALSEGARTRALDDLERLTAPRVRAKALLRMRLHERSSEYEYTEVANMLA